MLDISKFFKKLAISSKTNLIVNLYVVKNIWKLKKINTKKGFQCSYAPVILIDLIYREYENYCPKVCYVIQDIKNFFSNSDEP